MIKPNELRVGNWINDIEPYEFQFQVNSNHIAKCEYGHPYRPIPLTKEWLLKFGFDVVGNTWNVKENPVEFRILFLSGTYLFQWGRRLDTRLEHVHQLQNLYFCLCGTELELKQTP